MSTLAQLTDLKDTLFNTITRNKEIITGVVTGASETTRLVVTATNNEQWGPTGPQMRQIADLTFNYADCTQVMESVWERLETDVNSGANWRNIYKTLLLLDYLIRNGSERIVNEARQNIYQIKSLTVVHFIDSEGTDRGVSIRERSKQVVELLGDTVRLREERKKCKQNRDKYSTAYGNESSSYDRPYGGGGRSNFNFDEEDNFSSRKPKSNFNITEDDFKDDFKDEYAHKSTSTKSFRKEPENDFAPFQHPTPNPTPTPVQPTPTPVQTKPPVNNNNNVAWDPFLPAQPAQPAQGGWDIDFDPRGNPAGNNNNNANIFAPISPISNPVVPPINNTIPPATTNPPLSNSLPPNLFTPAVNPIPSLPLTHNNSVPVKPNTTPVKSNDPWDALHLYNLSSNPMSPRSNSVNNTTSKPLGATVGTGWNTTTTAPVTTVPINYAHGYPTNVAYPVTYATYPVNNPNTSTNMFNTPNYSNTSQWGI